MLKQQRKSAEIYFCTTSRETFYLQHCITDRTEQHIVVPYSQSAVILFVHIQIEHTTRKHDLL